MEGIFKVCNSLIASVKKTTLIIRNHYSILHCDSVLPCISIQKRNVKSNNNSEIKILPHPPFSSDGIIQWWPVLKTKKIVCIASIFLMTNRSLVWWTVQLFITATERSSGPHVCFSPLKMTLKSGWLKGGIFQGSYFETRASVGGLGRGRNVGRGVILWSVKTNKIWWIKYACKKPGSTKAFGQFPTTAWTLTFHSSNALSLEGGCP